MPKSERSDVLSETNGDVQGSTRAVVLFPVMRGLRFRTSQRNAASWDKQIFMVAITGSFQAQITSQTSMTPPSYTTLARISHTAPPNLAGRLPIHLSSRSNSALTKPEDVPLHPDQFHKSTEAKLTTSYSPLARTCKHRNHRPETESSKCKESKNAKDEKQRPRINLASRRHCPAWLP